VALFDGSHHPIDRRQMLIALRLREGPIERGALMLGAQMLLVAIRIQLRRAHGASVVADMTRARAWHVLTRVNYAR
jgi:hypothetical protein